MDRFEYKDKLKLLERLREDFNKLKDILPEKAKEIEDLIEELEEKLADYLMLPINDIEELLDLEDYKIKTGDETSIGIVMYPKRYITWEQLKELEKMLKEKYGLEIKDLYIDVWTNTHEPPFSEAYLEFWLEYGYPEKMDEE